MTEPRDRLAQAWGTTLEEAETWAVAIAAHRSNLRRGRRSGDIVLDVDDQLLAVAGSMSLRRACTAEEAIAASILTAAEGAKDRAIDTLARDWAIDDRDEVARIACAMACRAEALRRGRTVRVDLDLPDSTWDFIHERALKLGIPADDAIDVMVSEHIWRESQGNAPLPEPAELPPPRVVWVGPDGVLDLGLPYADRSFRYEELPGGTILLTPVDDQGDVEKPSSDA